MPAKKKVSSKDPQSKMTIVTIRLDLHQYRSLARMAIRRSVAVSTMARELLNETLYDMDSRYRAFVESLIDDEFSEQYGDDQGDQEEATE